MKTTLLFAGLVVCAGLSPVASAEVKVATGYSVVGAGFAFKEVPLPANNDAASAASFILLDGAGDRNGGSLAVLHDGHVPSTEDQPSKNFFFQAGSDGGRLRIDLGREIQVARVCSYSWHSGGRGPQVYVLYAADGKSAGFDPEPRRGVDPRGCGWTFLARVDTRRGADGGGGQHGVAVTSDRGAIGSFRHLLFDISPAERDDPFGNTFYSEIDVLDANGPAPTFDLAARKPIQTVFEAENGRFRFVIDATDAPDLAPWSEQALKPVIQAWYPQLAAMLASDGYQAPADIALCFRNDLGGTPAAASGRAIRLNAAWFRGERDRQALGAVVHELVHVVQDYGRTKRTNPNFRAAPGWVVEGIADYIRWFLYEPQSRGAEITEGNLAAARYDASYRISANFLDWVTRTRDRDLVRKLNAAAREGRYSESLWEAWTGESVEALGEEWRRSHARRLGGA